MSSHKYKIGDCVMIINGCIDYIGRNGIVIKLQKTIYDIRNQNIYVLDLNENEWFHEDNIFLLRDIEFKSLFKVDDYVKFKDSKYCKSLDKIYKINKVIQYAENTGVYSMEIVSSEIDEYCQPIFVMENQIESIKNKITDYCIKYLTISDLEEIIKIKNS